jgi:hypothetical protein
MYYKHIKKDKNEKNILMLDFIKNRFEFIFLILIAILLLIIFNPFNKNPIKINNTTKTLLFIYAIIILINVDWKGFINSSYIYKNIKNNDLKNNDLKNNDLKNNDL